MRALHPLTAIAAAVVLGLLCLSVDAGPITTSATKTFNGTREDYGYSLSISQESDTLFKATLENTSTPAAGDENQPVIDLIAFGMVDATLGTDFDITASTAGWTFEAASGGVLFDYVGSTDSSPIEPGDALVFYVDFSIGSFVFPTDPYSLWTDADPVKASGLGGGNKIGQVAVHFTGLGGVSENGARGVLASNWNGGPGEPPSGDPVPEPMSLLLLGNGIGACLLARRRRQRHQAANATS